MPALICNLPAYEVWVRKEYLLDHKGGHGEFVKGVWVSAKSIPGRAFYFETYLPEYAAMFDKLPISEGILPEKLLSFRCKNSKYSKLPISEGIDPSRLD